MTALDLATRAAPTAADRPSLAGSAITALGFDLLAVVAASNGPDGNVVVSPTSVAIALAMLEPGAVGDAQSQLRKILRIEDPAAYHASMNALEQDLESRVAEQSSGPYGDPGEVLVRIANAAYLQEGYPFEQSYLDTIGTNYGPVLNTVDFEADPHAVAHEINRSVAEETHDRITALVADGVLTKETVLALVNALYLKASWAEVFPEGATADSAFTLLDGTVDEVPLMHGRSTRSASGDGWLAAVKPYVGGLAAEFVLPDEGRFGEVAADLASVVAAFDAKPTGGGELAVPRFATRFGAEISDALKAMGLTAPYVEGHLLGIADDSLLLLDAAIHQTFLAMDEKGTEAAAATVLVGRAMGAPVEPPPPVILDRPFLFRIFDADTGATLFIGRVLDPTS